MFYGYSKLEMIHITLSSSGFLIDCEPLVKLCSWEKVVSVTVRKQCRESRVSVPNFKFMPYEIHKNYGAILY